ncbi:MAG: hypothetical protein AABX71_00315 [Nanoarchaeota archaeon]
MPLFKSQKHIFWQALLLALIMFNIGIFLGYSLEANRAERINKLYIESDIELLDIKIQDDAFYVTDINCEKAVEENIKFADRVYEEALLLKKYEDANRINQALTLQHKKYDLLRTYFWLNSIKLKEKCKADYHNVVYFYQYNEPSLDIEAKQRALSTILEVLKQRQGNRIMLIPIAGDMDLSSINLLLDSYGVNELPTIFIDENIKITDIVSVEELEKFLD